MHIQEKNSCEEWGTLRIKKLFVNRSCLGVLSEKYPPFNKNKPLMHLHSKVCWESSNKNNKCKDRPENIPNKEVVLSDENLFLPEVHVFFQTVTMPYNKEKIWWFKLKQILEEHLSFSDLKLMQTCN